MNNIHEADDIASKKLWFFWDFNGQIGEVKLRKIFKIETMSIFLTNKKYYCK
jgi:hypothetical protein